jgi:hypothetical protein
VGSTVGAPDPEPHGPDEGGLDPTITGAATELPATRVALRRSVVLIVLFSVMAIGLAVGAAGSWWSQHQVMSLDDVGVRTTGTVTSVQSRIVARERQVTGSIDVAYDVGGRSQQHRFGVSNHVAQYHQGDRVDLAYDPSDPTSVDLVGEPVASQGFVPWEVLAAFAVLALLLSGVAVRHLRRVSRVLASNEWLAVPAVRKPSTRAWRGRGTTVIELGEPSSPERVVASPVGIRALPPTIEPIAWVAGWGERRFVVAPPGGRPLLLVQRLSDLGTDAVTDRGAVAPTVDPQPRHAP